MKTLLLKLLFLLLSIPVYSQSYSDWKDFGLKMRPKHIIEARMYSLVGISDTLVKDLFQTPNILLIARFEKYFDRNGLLIKSYFKEIDDSIGQWSNFNDLNKRRIYEDSVINHYYHKEGFKTRTEKYILNKDGYPVVKIIDYPRDTTYLYRNDKNQILIKEEIYNGIDDWFRSITKYTIDSCGNVLRESHHFKDGYPGGPDPDNFERITEYKYIYDDIGNWIIKVEMQNSEILNITERKIDYY
jgi:hypothetical protein